MLILKLSSVFVCSPSQFAISNTQYMSTLPALAVRPKVPLRQVSNLNDASIDAYSNIENMTSRSDTTHDSAGSRIRGNTGRVARSAKDNRLYEARLLHQYQYSDEEEINLLAGEIVQILAKKHSGTYKCRYNDKVVYIPSSNLEILEEASDGSDIENIKKSRRKKKNRGASTIFRHDEDWPQDPDGGSNGNAGGTNAQFESRKARKKHRKHRRHRKEKQNSDSSAIESELDQSQKLSGRDVSVEGNGDDEDLSDYDPSELPRHRHRRHHRSKRVDTEADDENLENSELVRHHRHRHHRRHHKEKSQGKEAGGNFRKLEDRHGQYINSSIIVEENSSEEDQALKDSYHSTSPLPLHNENSGEGKLAAIEKRTEQLTLQEKSPTANTQQGTNSSVPSAAKKSVQIASIDESAQSTIKHDESRKNESVDVKQGKVGFGKQIGDKVRHLLGRKNEVARKEASGILNACAGTVQGEEGWYEHGDHERYYFTLVDNKWNLLYGPISEENFDLYCIAVTERNRMVELPPTFLHKSGFFLDRYFHVRKLD